MPAVIRNHSNNRLWPKTGNKLSLPGCFVWEEKGETNDSRTAQVIYSTYHPLFIHLQTL
jgi:hypothetical protein